MDDDIEENDDDIPNNVEEDEETNKAPTTFNDLAEVQLARIHYWDFKIAAFDWSLQGVNALRYLDHNGILTNAIATIRGHLYQELGNAYQSLFMLGCFDRKTSKKARKLALERIITEHTDLSSMIKLHGYGFLNSEDNEELLKLFRDRK